MITLKSMSQLDDQQLAAEQVVVLRQYRFHDACDDIRQYDNEKQERELCQLYWDEIKQEMTKRGLTINYQ